MARAEYFEKREQDPAFSGFHRLEYSLFQQRSLDGLAPVAQRLLPVLPDEINLTRQFWMYCREDLRKLKRITLLWDYIREVTEQNQRLLMGESGKMLFTDSSRL